MATMGHAAATQTAEPALPKGAKLAAPAGHLAGVKCLSFSPDGRQLLSGSDDQSLLVWDVDTGAPVQRLTGHSGCVSVCAFLPDGRHAVSAGCGGEVFVWQVDSGGATKLTGLPAADAALSLGLRGDGTEVAVGTYYGRLQAWDLTTGTPSLSRQLWPTEHDRRISAVTSEAGDWLVSSRQGTLRVTTQSDSEDRMLSSEPSTSSLRLSDGRVVIGREGVFILSDERIQVGSHSDWVSTLAATPQEDAVLAGDYTGVARFWQLKTKALLCEIRLPAAIRAAAIDPMGRYFALAGEDTTVRVYPLKDCERGTSPRPLYQLRPRQTRAFALAILGQELAVGDGSGRLSLWNLLTQRQRESVPVHRGSILALAAVSPGSLVSGGFDFAVFHHEVGAGGALVTRELLRVDSEVFSLQPINSGQELLVGDSDGNVTQIAIAGGTANRILQTGGQVYTMALDQHRDTLILGGAFHQLYHFEKGYHFPLTWDDALPSISTYKLVFSPNGQRFAQGAVGGGTVQLRSAETGAVIRRLQGLEDQVQGLVFAADNELWGADGSGILVKWDLDQSVDAPVLLVRLGKPILALVKDPQRPVLYAAMHDGRVLTLSLPRAERVAELVPLRDGSWATIYPDGRVVTEGALAQGLEFELPDRRVINPLGKSGPPRFSAPRSDRLQSALVRVRGTVFSPGGRPQLSLDAGWALPSLRPSPSIPSAYEFEFFMRERDGGNHAIGVTDPNGEKARIEFAVAPDPSQQGTSAPPALQALLIGNRKYQHHDELPGATEDVDSFQRFLTEEPRGLLLPRAAVHPLYDLQSSELHDRVRDFFRQAAPTQTLLFYFSGHGTSENEQGHLLPIDAPAKGVEGALSTKEIWEAIMDSPAARVVVILDACRSGSFLVPSDLERSMNQSGKVLLLAATSANRSASDTSKGGAYTRAFLAAALDPQAVDRELGAVTLTKTHYVAALSLEDQDPRLFGSSEVGLLVIASPDLHQERLAMLTVGTHNVKFTGDPEVRRPRQAVIGPQHLFGAGNERTIKFEVYVTHATPALRASVVRSVPNATPRPVYLDGPPTGIPASTTRSVELPLSGLETGDYELQVEICRSETVCVPEAKAKFRL